MTHGSLFSGGGGFDLAASALGWKNVFHCEIEPFCRKILNHYWPDAESYHDIREFDARKFKGKIDILTGGFPCQPFSLAGKRKGTADNRYLWPEMLRVIQEIEPAWVVAENVYGILNWNDGMVFDKVHSDLEAAGYEVQTFLLPACGVNAPHRRYRVWFVAHAAHSIRRKEKYPTVRKQKETHIGKRQNIQPEYSRYGLPPYAANSDKHGLYQCNRENEKYTSKKRKYAQCNPQQVGIVTTNSDSQRLERCKNSSSFEKSRAKMFKQFARLRGRGYWRNWPTQPPVCGRNDGLPTSLDGITISKWRKETIKAYGNAIVPQVAMQIFKAIAAVESDKP